MPPVAATAWICFWPVGLALNCWLSSSVTALVSTRSGPWAALGSLVPWICLLSSTGVALRVIVTFAEGATRKRSRKPSTKIAPATMYRRRRSAPAAIPCSPPRGRRGPGGTGAGTVWSAQVSSTGSAERSAAAAAATPSPSAPSAAGRITSTPRSYAWTEA